MITHLEPDILECEVKWALGSITMNKASGGDGIPVELFQILKDDAVKVLHSVCSKLGKRQWPKDWKRSVFIPMLKKGNAKECCNYHTIVLISYASICSKSFNLGFSSMWTKNLHKHKMDFEEAVEPEIKSPTFAGSQRKQGSSRKISASQLTKN